MKYIRYICFDIWYIWYPTLSSCFLSTTWPPLVHSCLALANFPAVFFIFGTFDFWYLCICISFVFVFHLFLYFICTCILHIQIQIAIFQLTPPCALLSFAHKFPCCVFHFWNFWFLIFVYLFLYLLVVFVFVFYRYKYKLRSTSWHPLCIPVLRAPICQLAPSKETFAVSSLETHGLANTWFG